MIRTTLMAMCMVWCGGTASAQFLSHIDVGAGLRQEQITSTPHKHVHRIGTFPVISASTPFHWGAIVAEIGFAKIHRLNATGFDFNRTQVVIHWKPVVPLTNRLTAHVSVGTGIDRYNSTREVNPSEIENLIALGFSLEQNVGPLVIAAESRMVRVLTYRPMLSVSYGLSVRYHIRTPDWIIDVVH
jgi:hypothetical protein